MATGCDGAVCARERKQPLGFPLKELVLREIEREVWLGPRARGKCTPN